MYCHPLIEYYYKGEAEFLEIYLKINKIKNVFHKNLPDEHESIELIIASGIPISLMPISDGWNNNSGIVNLSLFNLIIFILMKEI